MPQKFEPRLPQQIGLKHLARYERCALWASMGMGKTVTTLTHLNRLYMQGVRSPTLILAPTLVANDVWPAEVKKWNHLKHIQVQAVTGTDRQRRKALMKDANVFTLNYENVPWLVDLYGERWPFRTIIADESTRLKNFRLGARSGKRSAALGKIAHSKVARFIQLTGTCAPNGLLDLWGQLWMIDRGQRLGRTITEYKDRWFVTRGYQTRLRPGAQEEITERIKDVCLSLDAKDFFDLDEPVVIDKYIELPDKIRTLYKKMEREFYIELKGKGVNAVNSAAKTQKLLQIASGAVYIDPAVDNDEDPRSKAWKEAHDLKIQMLDSIVTEANGMPVLVAYHFRSDLQRLTKAFPKGVVLTKQDSTAIQEKWNTGQIPILFAHPQRAGHGLNLQLGGNILVYFSHDWNLENRLQILERIGPMRQMQAGLKRPVFVYNIIARKTMDEVVIARTTSKISVQEAVTRATNVYLNC